MHISCIIFAPLWGLFLSSHILRICQWVLWFKHKFSQCDGRKRIFSFYRKICKAALALISGSLCKDFHFMQLSLFSECQSKLQICSSERNIRLLPVDWRKDKFKIEAANSEDWRKDKFKIGGRKIL